MTSLDLNARREGRKAMEKSLTAASRVRRSLKAGSPRRIHNVRLTHTEAILRLVTEANKARGLMRAEGLDPDDINCALIFCTPELPGFENSVRYKWLPAPGQTSQFFDWFEDESKKAALLFLGILWNQEDREARAKGEDGSVSWVRQFLAGPEAERRLLAARDFFVSGGSKILDN